MQTAYKYFAGRGIAGGLVDLAPYAIDSFINEEENGVLKPGLAAMSGTTAGTHIKLYTGADANFEGVINNNRNTEYDLDGHLRVLKGAGVGVVRWGRVYVRVAEDVEVAYDDPLYVVKTGDETGFFTNTAGESGSETAVAVRGRFLGPVENGIAPVELFNQADA